AQLAVAGVRLRTGWLFSGRDATDVSGAAPPPQPRWTVDGHLVRTADCACLPGGLAPARRVRSVNGAGPSRPGAQREELVLVFLRTSREAVAAQRDVLLSCFGTAAGTEPAAQHPVRSEAAADVVSASSAPAPETATD